MKTLISNARIWLGRNYYASHIGFDDESGKIEFVGNSDSLSKCKIDFDEILNLPDKLVIPAFHDGHCHLLAGAILNSHLDLRAASTIKDFTDSIKNYSRENTGQWTCGGYFSDSNFVEHIPLGLDFFNSIESEKPLFIPRFDLHSAFVNSKALELSGIMNKSGLFTRDELIYDENGNPTGELKERAMEYVQSVIPQKSLSEKSQLLKNQIAKLHSLGITAVTDIVRRPDLEVYKLLLEKNEFGLFDYAVLPFSEFENIETIKKEFAEFRSAIVFKCFKAFYDGSLSSKTALMHGNYKGTNHCGIRTEFVDSGSFDKYFEMIDLADYGMAVHAIGDKAVTELLDKIGNLNKKSGIRPRRFRIEHAQHIQPADFERFRILNIIASVQPGHLSNDAKTSEEILNDISIVHNYRELLSRGVTINFGTDFPVIIENPFETIYYALTRAGLPGDPFTPDECLDAYTKANAYATYTEETRGYLKPGFIADLVITENLFEMNFEEIKKCKVIMTFKNGKRVY
ncbi:MAG: amidohydrolase [Ignavibacteriaceae bacterium]|jgi:predicted amidohydrolase YtcJ|nr:MAG: amidohydrolase [Chlorobiota bacterium]KXK06468.1 MAG: metal-dependent hydrolase [Chlorobi bacterium OLB4]MBV6399718.1 N-substituted formamide deformylase [Ignavibacteria bacterium]MCC6885234.1 amidohydrolase [Ignavibacteriales bacterium]MCE7953363.1 amidohydrolase [Chlorobi bacterium CHB7]MDL1887221.1 amidohydrolase [Ignavibacteria bacterium CHB1]MEB2330554.1 amidohydrolase [Ignavibacteriaceae bacterium]OQY78161.1 MAG: hypothetical protein B6D43_03345 [Ignavibacteriales bacterium UTC